MTSRKTYPWWEPYAFTAGILGAFILLLIAFGYVAQIPLIRPILLTLATLGAVFRVTRKTAEPVAWNILATGFFGLLSCSYIAKDEISLAVWSATLAGIWFVITIIAVGKRRRINQDAFAKSARSLERLRHLQVDE